MDKVLRIEKFNALPSDPASGKEFKLWLRGFKYFLSAIDDKNPDKLEVLFLHIGTNVSDIIEGCADYESALRLLESAFIKTPSEIYARHVLSTRCQKTDEDLDSYLRALNSLANDCNFKAVSALENREDFVRDSFIRGLHSNSIRTRLLENHSVTLQRAFEQARSLEQAQKRADAYSIANPSTVASVSCELQEYPNDEVPNDDAGTASTAAALKGYSRGSASACYNCGGKRHLNDNRELCPARDSFCRKCGKKGHFARVCRSNPQRSSSKSVSSAVTLASVPSSNLSKTLIPVTLKGRTLQALIDTGSTENFISEAVVSKLSLGVSPRQATVKMASSEMSLQSQGLTVCDLTINEQAYQSVELLVLPELCADIILGHPFLGEHEGVYVTFGGSKPCFEVCAAAMHTAGVRLFANLSEDCRPIATRSRRFNCEDETFIRNETKRLLDLGIIEHSRSPWRAQVMVTPPSNRKRRMVIDFSRTINRFTLLDAFPLPLIDSIVNEVAKNRFFSVVDLSDAYYQIEISAEERPYTAFEAGGQLYQFTRIPMGVTNGVAAFQRVMSEFISTNSLEKTYAYLDDLTVCGSTIEEHDRNLQRFWEAAEKHHLTLNREKCQFHLTSINLLGHTISDGKISPDSNRLKPLLEMPIPADSKSLQRLIGFFAYYSKWIPTYSDRVRPLLEVTDFPLPENLVSLIASLKQDIGKAAISHIDDNASFTVETDASESAIGGTLSQEGRPVAFFSRALSKTEKNHHIIENEALAIIECVRKWRHFLCRRHFHIVTDQRALSFMFDNRAHGKVKNDKILRWRLELSAFSYDITYRPGHTNASADLLSRIQCAAAYNTDSLRELHEALVHPGVKRLLHFVRTRNLPYSVEEIRGVTSKCGVCAKIKPRFHAPPEVQLIKATSPFERLSIDFKGPLPTSGNSNSYILTVIDEFSRFPFAFPCRDVSANTVIKCLTQLFALFGLPAYVHSDRGSAFMSAELRQFLTRHGVCTSRTTPYNPRGNSQCERYNGIVWNSVCLAIQSRGLKMSAWETVLPDALHSIRSLLCTATNATPHERLFTYQRRSSSGQSLPTWLSDPGTVLLKRHVRQSKYEPLVEPVHLIEANPHYAHVRFPDGREDTVSVRDLAPMGTDPPPACKELPTPSPVRPDAPSNPELTTARSPNPAGEQQTEVAHGDETPLRRSARIPKPVVRLDL